MVDFDQLALKFVLEDNHGIRDALATEAATAIKNSPRASNPVRKWVESVRPWILGDNAESGSGDTIARARALDFLSTTLALLEKDILRVDQLRVLIAYFSSMFTIDSRSGILPSSKALSTLTTMKFFPVDATADMIHAVCAMGDDFRDQIPVTRLAVYEFFETCVTNPKIIADLRTKQGNDITFIKEIISMCRSERDPHNILKWFSLLTIFQKNFQPSEELSKEIFNTFAAYYPISLRAAQQLHDVTVDALKTALRECFSATSAMAPHTFPFLLEKLDSGIATVNVKLDIIRTLQAAIKSYSPSKTTIAPYADRIWNSLKYEIRNGDVDDIITATLDLFTSLTKALEDDDLRTFVLSVLRECTDDLNSTTYATSAGKLLVALMRAKFAAFAPLVAPTVNHIRDILRNIKSVEHASALLTLLNSILAIRILYLKNPKNLSGDYKKAFKAVDSTFASLYETTLKELFVEKSEINNNAVQTLGLLASQPSVKPGFLLLTSETNAEISATLTRLLVGPTDLSDAIIQDTVEAFQRVVSSWSPAFSQLIDTTLDPSLTSTLSTDGFTALTSRIAYIGCSSLPTSGSVYSHFLPLISRLSTTLNSSIIIAQQLQDFSHPNWSVYLTALQATLMNFSTACHVKLPKKPTLELPEGTTAKSWITHVAERFPTLPTFGQDVPTSDVDATVAAISEPTDTVHVDISLIGLYIIQGIVRQVFRVSSANELHIIAPFDDDSGSSRRFLFFLSQLTTYIVGELTEKQQQKLALEKTIFTLFHPKISENLLSGLNPVEFYNTTTLEALSPSRDLLPPFLDLSTAILQSIRPSVVSTLFTTGLGQQVIAQSLLPLESSATFSTTVAISHAYWLTVLANKHPFEKTPLLLSLVESRLSHLATTVDPFSAILPLVTAIYGLLAGALRRYTGNVFSTALATLCTLPTNPASGIALAQWFDYIFTPRPCLVKAFHGTTKPTWTQRAYLEILSPLLKSALPQPTASTAQEKFSAASSTIALLAGIRHLSFNVYEDDAPALVRTVLAALMTLPSSTIASPSLAILKTIMSASPTLLEGHAKSIIEVCLRVAVLTPDSATVEKVEDWFPQDIISKSSAAATVLANARKLALELLEQIPEKFSDKHLVSVAPKVKRTLAISSGDKVRMVRGVATKARLAWSTIG